MPKHLVQPTEQLNKVHPFRRAYDNLNRAPENVRLQIMTRLGWSVSTFYRKVSRDEFLTDVEAEEIARILRIPVAEIQDFQTRNIKSRK